MYPDSCSHWRRLTHLLWFMRDNIAKLVTVSSPCAASTSIILIIYVMLGPLGIAVIIVSARASSNMSEHVTDKGAGTSGGGGISKYTCEPGPLMRFVSFFHVSVMFNCV